MILSAELSEPSQMYLTLTSPLLITRKATGDIVTPAPPPPPKSSLALFDGKSEPPENAASDCGQIPKLHADDGLHAGSHGAVRERV